jgi:hypothetical protein
MFTGASEYVADGRAELPSGFIDPLAVDLDLLHADSTAFSDS